MNRSRWKAKRDKRMELRREIAIKMAEANRIKQRNDALLAKRRRERSMQNRNRIGESSTSPKADPPFIDYGYVQRAMRDYACIMYHTGIVVISNYL